MKCLAVNKLHSTRHMAYYDVYIIHKGQKTIKISSAYTNARFDEKNHFIDGAPIRDVFLREHCKQEWVRETVISPGFDGILRFEIPLDSQVYNNTGLMVEFEANDEPLQVALILLNNIYSKPKVLLPCGVTTSTQAGNIFSDNMIGPNHIQISCPQVLCKRSVSHLHEVGSSTYLIVHNISSNNNKPETRMHTAKSVYYEGEPVSITYENLISHLDTNIAGVEILMYKPGDIPGITRSVDWTSLKYLDKDLGTSNTITFPVDGERNVDIYTEGEYIFRLMYKYRDLCEPVTVNVVKDISTTCMKINPPSPGSFCIYQVDRNVESISLSENNSSQYLVVAFKCANSIMELLLNTSFKAQTDNYANRYIYETIALKDQENCIRDYDNDYTCLLSSYIYTLLYNAYYSVLIQSSKQFSYAYNNDPSHDLVTQIKNYIIHNIFEPISLDSLANHFYFSKSYISHVFKDITGISINRYISNARILKAKELLTKKDMSVTQVAQILNFPDIHTFSHKFKKETGMTPTQCKKEFKKVYERSMQ